MSSSDATALLYNVGLSVNQYQMLRTICLTHDIDLPTRNSVDSVKSSFYPIIVSQELKSSVDGKSLLCSTTALLELCDNHQIQGGSTCTVTRKFGADGSGSHKIHHQLVNSDIATIETPHHLKLQHSYSHAIVHCRFSVKMK